MRIIRRSILLVLCAGLGATATCATDRTLDVYFIDAEGGQSTLIVTPTGESLLVDTGYPCLGGSGSVPCAPTKALAANRIVAAAHDAGIKRIDYLLITHFHNDHDGGVVELSQLFPLGTFIDHGHVQPETEEDVPGSLAAFDRYAAVRAGHDHLEPGPGARLPLKDFEATVVSAAGSTMTTPLPGGGESTGGCTAPVVPANEQYENPRSTGFLLQFDRFRLLDVGDLSGAPLRALVCPTNLIGPIDVYLVAHHGGDDAADPLTFAALRPRVSVVNNGPVKGGAPELLSFLHATAAAGEVWQLHRSDNPGAINFDEARIANLDTSTGHWLKISARKDGSFALTNARTGTSVTYPPRSH